ncbi:LOW QUALITY PROTEIN: UBN2_3 domain-containing protein, partial [Cephalotus follicularis]
DASSPYYVHHLDNPGIMLVSQALTCDNYSTWSRSISMALEARNMLRFINGLVGKPPIDSSLLPYCSHRNSMFLSWILNSVSKDIASTYYIILKGLWDELANSNSLTACTCGVIQEINALQRDRLLQFLMGIKDSYTIIRSQILLMNPLPTVNKAYSMVLQEEIQ